MSKFQLKLKSLNKNIISYYILFLQKLFVKLNFIFKIVNLPKKYKKITLLKSPHVNKTAREQFQVITHTSFIFFISNVSFLNLKTFFLNKPKTIKSILKIFISK